MSTADLLSSSKYGYVEGFKRKGEKKGSQLFSQQLLIYCFDIAT